MKQEEFLGKYYINRKNTYSVKWDVVERVFGKDNVLPLWIADMDFKLAKPIQDGLINAITQTATGYAMYYRPLINAYIKWMLDRHNYQVDPEWISFSNGTVETIYHAINALTQPGDSIIIMTPVYGSFSQAIKKTGRSLVECPLIDTGKSFSIDYTNFQKLIENHNVKMFIQCSPHNPAGRVWRMEELEKVFSICEENDVYIVSDEIHQDFVFDNVHIPAPLVGEGKFNSKLITINSASKTFNMSGFAHANVIIPDTKLREKYMTYIEKIHTKDSNYLNMVAIERAYSEGNEWLDSCKEVIRSNYDYVKKMIEQIPETRVFDLEGTYLCFLDFRSIHERINLKEFMVNRCNLGVNYGEAYSSEYEGFIRINLATHPNNIELAMDTILTEYQKL